MNITDIIISEPSSEYHNKSRSGECVSSHLLKDFCKCPLLYYKKVTGQIVDEDKPAYALGRATHTLVLEGPEVFNLEYTTDLPRNPKTGQPYGASTLAYQNWLANQTKEAVSPADYEKIMVLRDAVWSHKEAAKLLTGIIAEGVIRVEWHGVKCQIRMDFCKDEPCLLGDLKTCDDVDFFPFDAKKYGYWGQMAFYQQVIFIATGIRVPVYTIAVEKKEPYRVRVDRLVEDDLATSIAENDAAIKRLKLCRESNIWPTNYEQLGYLMKF